MTGRDPAFAASPSSPCGSRPDGLQSGVGFTPGPWAVDDIHTCSVWSGDNDPIKVAETKGVRQADCYRKADDAEREANARLIAAAPELYEALVEHAVHEEFDYPGDAPESCGMWCNICNQHVDDDRVGGHAPTCILAKARGEAA